MRNVLFFTFIFLFLCAMPYMPVHAGGFFGGGSGGGSSDHLLLSNIGTNAHSVIDTHLASTADPHTVTHTQVGSATAQWNASKIQGEDVDGTDLGVGEDEYCLIYDHDVTSYIAKSCPGGVSDHGGLSGLGDDDHALYMLDTGGVVVDNQLCRFDGTDGRTTQLSTVTIDDDDKMTFAFGANQDHYIAAEGDNLTFNAVDNNTNTYWKFFSNNDNNDMAESMLMVGSGTVAAPAKYIAMGVFDTLLRISPSTTWYLDGPGGSHFRFEGTIIASKAMWIDENTKFRTAQLSFDIPAVLTPTGTTQTIDWNTGNIQELNIGSVSSSPVTLTFSNVIEGGIYHLKVIQGDVTGPVAITWPVSGVMRWVGGSAPTLTATDDAVDLIKLVCISATECLGTVEGQDFSAPP